MNDGSDKRPCAALINREWYAAAKGVLSPDALGRVLVAAIEYVLTGEQCSLTGQVEKAVFQMVRPSLDSDIAKYLERCARNAANARAKTERVAATGSDSQRVGANTTTTSTTTPTSTITLSREDKGEKEIEVEKWLITGYFWASGSAAVKEEFLAFWSYYEALGWKNNKGAAIVNKLAAARMWRRQFETRPAPDGAMAWFKAFEKCKIPDFAVWGCFRGFERTENGGVIRLSCKQSFLDSMRQNVPAMEPTLRQILRVPEIVFMTL